MLLVAVAINWGLLLVAMVVKGANSCSGGNVEVDNGYCGSNVEAANSCCGGIVEDAVSYRGDKGGKGCYGCCGDKIAATCDSLG